MFDYYRFRFSMFRRWNPEFGYELMAPAGFFGALLILFVLYLTSPDFAAYLTLMLVLTVFRLRDSNDR